MSSGHHHDDHSMEQKPVSFTVPFYLAISVLVLVLFFLSLCDPKPHHADAEGHGHGSAATEAAHHEAAPGVTAARADSLPVETTVPSAEPAHH